MNLPGQLSPLAILIGLLVSQALSACLAFGLAIAFLLIYGNQVMTAFFEYGSSIALTLALGLVATAAGGYASMMTPKKSLANAVALGVITLGLNIWLLALIDYRYAEEFRWLLLLAAALTVPAALLGAVLCRRHQAAAAARAD